MLSFLLIAMALASCEKTDKKEEVQFEGATFGFISKSKTTLETTLHSRQIYFKPGNGGDEKVLVGYGSKEMDIFPIDKAILSDVEYVVIDTVRYGDMQPATVASNTLYVDPAVFTKEEYDLIVRFVRSNFRNPITANQFVKWLDDDVLGSTPEIPYYTIYAVVYQKMAAFEREFKSPDGSDHFAIRVDNHLSVSKTQDGLEMQSIYDYIFRNDTLFFPAFEGIDEAKRMLTFRDTEGRTFGELAKVLVPTTPE